jgi:hypothetical protein
MFITGTSMGDWAVNVARLLCDSVNLLFEQLFNHV